MDVFIEYSTIRLDAADGIARLVLDRPHVLNALSAAMLDELLDAVAALAAEPAGVVILAGEGRAFCSGADLRSLPGDVDLADRRSVIAHMAKWRELITGIRSLPMPSVAAVHGAAYGGGANLALACDVVVAARSAVFCQSYVDRGVSTDLGGSYVLARLIGEARARHLLLTGREVSGAEAAAMGMVAVAVPADELAGESERVAAELAAKDPAAVRAMREVLGAGAVGTLGEALDREGEKVADLLTAPAFRKRLEDFLG